MKWREPTHSRSADVGSNIASHPKEGPLLCLARGCALLASLFSARWPVQGRRVISSTKTHDVVVRSFAHMQRVYVLLIALAVFAGTGPTHGATM